MTLITAVSQNNVIGLNSDIPWNIPADKKFFKQQTMGGALIMGRKTFCSICNQGRTLVGRKIVVVSSTQFSGSNIFSAPNITEALKLIANNFPELIYDSDKIFFAGGHEIYKTALDKNFTKMQNDFLLQKFSLQAGVPLATKLLLTEIEQEYQGDTFFPTFDKTAYKKTVLQSFAANNNTPAFSVNEYLWQGV